MIGWGAVSVKRSQPIRVRWLGLFVPLMGQGQLIPDAIVKKYCERKKKMPPRGCRVGRDSFRAGKVGTHTVAARIIIAQTIC